MSLQESLQVVRALDDVGSSEERLDTTIRVQTCDTLSKRLIDKKDRSILADCAAVDFGNEASLERGRRHRLVAPEGWKYNKGVDGPLRQSLGIAFYGLRSFRLPFKEFAQPQNKEAIPRQSTKNSNGYINGRNLTLWLPHGLAENVSLEQLKSAIILQHFLWDAPGQWTQVQYNLTRADRGLLFLTAPLKPGQRYKLLVVRRDDVKDGFGLSLEAGELHFSTSQPEPYAMFTSPVITRGPPQHIVIDGTDAKWDERLLHFRRLTESRQPGRIQAWSLLPQSEEELIQLGLMLGNSGSRNALANFTLGRDAIVNVTLPAAVPNEASVESVPLKDSLKKVRGMLLVGAPSLKGNDRMDYVLLHDIDFHFLVAESVHQDVFGRFRLHLVCLVTSAITGEPLPNVNITVMQHLAAASDQKEKKALPHLDVLGQQTTTKDGVARFHLRQCRSADRCHSVQFFVETRTRSILMPHLGSSDVPLLSNDVGAELVLDRRVLAPGDTLHVAGYLISREHSYETQPLGRNPGDHDVLPVFTVSPPVHPRTAKGDTEEIPIRIDPEFGTFQLSIDIPKDTPEGEYVVGEPFFETFVVGNATSASAKITVATPLWVRPGDSLEVTVEIADMLGKPVANAALVFKWGTVRHGQLDSRELQSDSTGEMSTMIRLEDAKDSVEQGDVIEIGIECTTPNQQCISGQTTVPVALTPLSVEVGVSLDPLVPGETEFGVHVLMDSKEGTVEPYDLEVELLDLEDKSDLSSAADRSRRLAMRKDRGIVSDIVDSCRLQSDTPMPQMWRDCRFVLPAAGHYALRACVEIDEDFACGIRLVGRTLKEWETAPLDHHPDPTHLPFLANQVLSLNADYVYTLNVPYPNFRGIVIWGNKVQSKEKILHFKKAGVQSIVLPVGEECRGGCDVQMVFAAPRRSPALEIGVPTHFAFDQESPFVIERSGSIDIKDAAVPFELEIALKLENAAVLPGSTVAVDIAVVRCMGDPNLVEPATCEEKIPARNVELVLMAVDKNHLMLEDNPLKDLSAMEVTWTGPQNARALTSNWPSPRAASEYADLMMRIEEMDPWQLQRFVSSSLPLDGWQPQSEGELLLNTYHQSHQIAAEIPGLARKADGRPKSSPFLAPSKAGQRGVPPGIGRGSAATPLFTVLKTDGDGKASVNFTAPPDPGTFVLRAYGAALDAQRGSAEIEITSRFPLRLTPLHPRFVRIGDFFKVGVGLDVTVEPEEIVPIHVSLLNEVLKDSAVIYHPRKSRQVDRFGEPDQGCAGNQRLECVGILDSMEIVPDAHGQARVYFDFSAVRLGDAQMTLRATAAGRSETVQVTLPVYAPQEHVMMSTAFAWNSKKNKRASLGELELPAALPGSGTVNLFASVGRVPAVVEMTKDFVDMDAGITAAAALANISMPLILQGVSLHKSKRKPALYKRALNGFSIGMDYLKTGSLTDEAKGLKRSLRREDADWTDVDLNIYAVSIASRVIKGLDRQGRDLREGVKHLRALVKMWRGPLVDQYLADAITIVEQGGSVSGKSVLRFLEAMGEDWEVPECPRKSGRCAGEELAELLSIDRLLRDFKADLLNAEEEVLLALVLLEWEGRRANQRPEVQEILGRLTAGLRTVGRTAYVAANAKTSTPAGSLEQVEALRVFVVSGLAEGDPLVERLATHVASGNVGSGVFFSRSLAWSTAAMFALMEYDQLTGSSDPNAVLEIANGNVTLLKADFSSLAEPVAESSTSFDDLGRPPSPLVFSGEGAGRLALVASLDFVPAQMLKFPAYRGLFVERVVRESDADGKPIGPPLGAAPLGTTVVVTLQITTPDSLDEVIVQVSMPGGLEPIDPPVIDASTTATCELDDLKIQFPLWPWPLCPAQEARPSVVMFTYFRLRGGTHGIRFAAVAANVGDWGLPPVRAFASAQPEVMGLSLAGEFTVCEGQGCRVRRIREDGISPQNCPDNCSGSGICDVSSGECRCDVGFGGDSCNSIRAS